MTPDGLPLETFESQHAFERWLEANHDRAAGVWLRLAKQGSGETTVSYTEAVGAS